MTVDDDRNTRLSQTLAHMLRHKPEQYDVHLDEAGWVAIESVIAALARHQGQWADLRTDDIRAMMAAAEKQRFEIDGERIRAVYGHSVAGRIEQRPAVPPELLYHGTTRAALKSIGQHGLRPMRRQFVHLSPDTKTAVRVARRRTKAPVILVIDAQRAHEDGVAFYATNDQVWLAERIAPEYLRKPDPQANR